jgi:hypothetical protein
MPPGEVPSSSVTGCRPVPRDKSQANPAHSPIITRVPSATEASQRGAVCRKPEVKRTPRLTPITNCAAFDNATGIADSVMPAMVKPIATTSDPHEPGIGAAQALHQQGTGDGAHPQRQQPRWMDDPGPRGRDIHTRQAAGLQTKGNHQHHHHQAQAVCGGHQIGARMPTRSASKVISRPRRLHRQRRPWPAWRPARRRPGAAREVGREQPQKTPPASAPRRSPAEWPTTGWRPRP